jgi:hypothetical protein
VYPGPELEGSTLVVGGDGRFFMTDAVDIIIKECSTYIRGLSALLLPAFKKR